MITTTENDIIMSKKSLYDIFWAISKLEIPEDNTPRSIMIRHILVELREDVKMLEKSDKRVREIERKDKERKEMIYAI